MKEALTQILGRLLWGLIEGCSLVTFDWKRGRVSKTQHPRIFIRLLNILAFQRWTTFYETKIGLEIAKYRREIVHWVLLCNDINCKVAPCLGIEEQSGQLALVTKLIEGRQPEREETIPVSEELTVLFLRAGISTWPICRFHPRFETNFIIDSEGTPWIIDLESHVLTIFVPFKELWDNLLVGNFPPFDDIHFPKLRRFFRKESSGLPVGDKERFRVCIQKCEELTRKQKSAELRIWSRLVGFLSCILRVGKEWDR